MRKHAVFLAFLVFLIFSGALEGLVARHISTDLQYRVTFVLTLITGSLFLPYAFIRNRQAYLTALRSAFPFLLYLIWAFISMLWSIAPMSSLISSLLLFCVIFTACSLVALITWRELLTGVALSCLCLGILSVILIPAGGLMDEVHIGALRGPFPEKNYAATVYAIGGLTALGLCFFSKNPVWLLVVAFQFGLLIMSQSGTSTLAFLAAAAGLCLIEALKERPWRLVIGVWSGTLAVIALGYLLVNNSEAILTALGEDSTFTGRDRIWSAVWLRVQNVLWFGYGYGTFWRDPNMMIQWMWYEAGYEFFNAHNSWLDIMLVLGIPGLCLMLLGLVRPLFIGLVGLSIPGDFRRFALPALLLVIFISLTESVIGSPDGPVFMFMMVIAIKTMMPENRSFTYHRFEAGVRPYQ